MACRAAPLEKSTNMMTGVEIVPTIRMRAAMIPMMREPELIM
jgi:hypothetical protein